MNKKVLIVGLVLILGVAAFFGYDAFFGQKAQEGSKTVTVEIVAESQGINETYEYKTDAAFLYDLLVEHQEALEIEFAEGGFVTSMMGYTADEAKKEFYSILINGEYAMTGAKETPVEDGTVFRFELSTW